MSCPKGGKGLVYYLSIERAAIVITAIYVRLLAGLPELAY